MQSERKEAERNNPCRKRRRKHGMEFIKRAQVQTPSNKRKEAMN